MTASAGGISPTRWTPRRRREQRPLHRTVRAGRVVSVPGSDRTIEVAPHNCFACGALNDPRDPPGSPRRRGPLLDRARPARSIPGLGRDRSRRDHLHDPRRGHGLVPRGDRQLGPDRPDERRVQASRSAWAWRSAAKAGSTAVRGRIVETAARIVGPRHRSGPGHGQRQVRRGRCCPQGGAPGALPVPAHADRRPSRRRRRPRQATGVMPATTSPITARAVELVADRRPAAEDLGRRLAEETGDPDGFADVLRAGLTALADPEYLAGQRRIAPGIGDLHGVRWPLIEAIKRGFRAATRTRADVGLALHRRSPARRAEARGALVRVRASRATGRRRHRASVAAHPPRGPRRRRLDHRRQPRPSGRQGRPERGVPLGGARAARLQSVALGAPARRQHDRDDPAHRSPARPRARGRGPRAGPHPRADRRRRAGCPEGPRLGPPRDGRRRPRRNRGTSSTPRQRPAATTSDGHRAWVIRDALSEARARRRRPDPRSPDRHPPPGRHAGHLARRRDGQPLRSRSPRPPDAGATTVMTFAAPRAPLPPHKRTFVRRA